jgi:hypothetical protein
MHAMFLNIGSKGVSSPTACPAIDNNWLLLMPQKLAISMTCIVRNWLYTSQIIVAVPMTHAKVLSMAKKVAIFFDIIHAQKVAIFFDIIHAQKVAIFFDITHAQKEGQY